MPVKKIADKKYRATYQKRLKNGDRIVKKRTFGKKADADKQLVEWEIEFSTGDRVSDGSISLPEYFIKWVNTFKKPSISNRTYEHYMTTYNTLKLYFPDTSINSISRLEYQDFINDYARGKDLKKPRERSRETVSKLHTHIRASILSALEDGYIRRNFTNSITISGKKPVKTLTNYLEADDFETLKSYLIKHINSLNICQQMVYIALVTGMRVAEIAALQDTPEDLNYDHATVCVTKSYDWHDDGFKPTKTTLPREIDVPKELLDQLQQFAKRNYPNSRHLIFANDKGVIPDNHTINDYLQQTLRMCNVNRPDFTFHGLRHSHASYLIYKDVDIYYISQRLGHSKVSKTLDVYAHLLKRKEKQEIEKTLNAIF